MTISLGNVAVVAAPAVLPTVVAAPTRPGTVVVALAGPEGQRGLAGGDVFEYQMSVAQTTAVVAHTLGRDPIAVQVLLDGQECSEFEVVFTIPGEQVRIGFDIPIAAFIRLI